MPRGLLLEPFSGISGDMFIGALLDLGLDFEALRAGLATIPIGPYRLTREPVMRGALRATKFDVVVRLADGREVREARPISEAEQKRAAFRGAHHHHDHHHHHLHDHSHGHGHPHSHDAGAIESGVFGGHDPHAHGRSFADIRGLIAASGLSERVKATATAIFTTLATAEGRVHGIPVEAVHFHEVGAIDSIIDVCGAALGLELLGIEEITSTAVTVGVGTAQMAHGRLPLPAPAAAEILCGMPQIRSTVTDELVTPTGAAILKILVGAFDRPMTIRPVAIGYGAGSTPRADPPNVLRATLYERDAASPRTTDRVACLETQVDDMTAEAIGFLRERLEAAGALDVLIQPVMMKKNRPGFLLTVLGRESEAGALEAILFADSSTFGVRKSLADRVILDREIVWVETPLGRARVKIGRLDGRILKAAPEYEDCAAIARERGLSLDAVMRAVREAFGAR